MAVATKNTLKAEVLPIIVIIAVIIGSQLGGNFMSGRAKGNGVKQMYALMLLAIAVKLIFDAF